MAIGGSVLVAAGGEMEALMVAREAAKEARTSDGIGGKLKYVGAVFEAMRRPPRARSALSTSADGGAVIRTRPSRDWILRLWS